MAPLIERDADACPPSTKENPKKRKSEADKFDPESVELPDHILMDWNANQVRSKIRAYLNSGEMKVGEFQKTIGVNSKGYGMLMGQNGPNDGTGSNTYVGAFEFFKEMELAGHRMPRKKAKPSEKGGQNNNKYDVSGIKLDGEDNECVPIFYTCDDVRRKVNAHLREPGNTNAGFLREIGKMFATLPPKGMGTTSLKTFLSHKGADSDTASPIFYGAYCYFEKLRIKDKKPKSKKRLEMENVWPKGMDRIEHSGRVIMPKDQTMTTDQYGRTEFYSWRWFVLCPG